MYVKNYFVVIKENYEMNRLFVKISVTGLFIFLVILLTFITCSYARPKNLTVVGIWSNLDLYRSYEEPFWKNIFPKEMGEGTDITLTSLSQLSVADAGVLRQMELGLFDVVSINVDYVTADCPELDGVDLPALALDAATAQKVAEVYRPVLSDLVKEKWNAKLLAIVGMPAQVLFLKDKIDGLKDIKGRKIRASGWNTARFIEALGATPVNVNFGETTTGLQRGVIDGAITGSLSGYTAGWGEITKYIYPLAIGGWDHIMIVMNMDTWNEFDSKEQEILLSLIKKEIETPDWELKEEKTQEGLDQLTGGRADGIYPFGKPNNMEIIEVKPEDVILARKILLEIVLPEWTTHVDEIAIDNWNNTIGKVYDLELEKE